MILRFPSLNTILIRRILLSEPCTIYISNVFFWFIIQCFTMCFKCFNVLILHNFFHCSACAFDMCLLNYLLTYLHTLLFLFYPANFSRITLVKAGPLKVKFWELSEHDIYRPDALSFTQSGCLTAHQYTIGHKF